MTFTSSGLTPSLAVPGLEASPHADCRFDSQGALRRAGDSAARRTVDAAGGFGCGTAADGFYYVVVDAMRAISSPDVEVNR
jgi:hypothetical protein